MRLNYLVGCPRSGKSTFSKKWQKEKSGRVVVCADAFRVAIYDKAWWRHGESMAYAHAYVATRAFLNEGYEVLYDDTNTSDESLKRLFEIDEWAKPIYINTQIETCHKRADETLQSYLHPVIDRCYSNIQYRINKIRKNSDGIVISDEAAVELYCLAYFDALRKIK